MPPELEPRGTASPLEIRAQALIGQLDQEKLAAIVRLLELIVADETATLSPAEAQAMAEAEAWLEKNEPIPHEQVLADAGLTPPEWERLSRALRP